MQETIVHPRVKLTIPRDLARQFVLSVRENADHPGLPAEYWPTLRSAADVFQRHLDKDPAAKSITPDSTRENWAVVQQFCWHVVALARLGHLITDAGWEAAPC